MTRKICLSLTSFQSKNNIFPVLNTLNMCHFNAQIVLESKYVIELNYFS